MIVGHGLMAGSCLGSIFDSPRYTVFASGVSNSNETDPAAFARERRLLETHLSKGTILVYFSTLSVFDPSRQDTPYIRHKLWMEKMILEASSAYFIARLPIMVSRAANPHTLINFLVNAIRQQSPIRLHRLACRYLLDIEDMVPAMSDSMQRAGVNRIINVPGSPKITLPDLIARIEDRLGQKGVYAWIEEGACYDIPADAGEIIFMPDADYIDKVLAKYIS